MFDQCRQFLGANHESKSVVIEESCTTDIVDGRRRGDRPGTAEGQAGPFAGDDQSHRQRTNSAGIGDRERFART